MRPPKKPADVRMCALYGRVSTDRQARVQDGGLDTQFALMQKRVEYQNSLAPNSSWTIHDRYREEGKSGKNLDRPEFQRMRRDIEAGEVNTVIVHKIDRITRSLQDFFELSEMFDQNGVQFISLNENFDTTNAMGRAMLKFILVFAELEREQTGERTAATMAHRARRGLHNGGRVLGYDRASENGQKGFLKINEEQAAIVRDQIFKKYLELGSAGEVVRHLKSIGYTRPTYESRRGKKQGGSPLDRKAILGILTNPAYIGKIQYKDERFEGQHEPIIEVEMFELVRQQLARNNRSRKNLKVETKHTYLLQGMLRCGRCAGMMTPTASGGRNGKIYHYYQCAKATSSNKTQCTEKNVPAKAIEEFVIGEIEKVANDPEVISRAIKKANELASGLAKPIRQQIRTAEKGLKQVESKISPTLEAIENGTPFKSLEKRLGELEAEKTMIETKLAELGLDQQRVDQQQMSAEVMAENYRTLPQILADAQKVGAWQEIKELLRCYVDVIEWHRSPEDEREGRVDILLYERPALEGNCRAECSNWLPELATQRDDVLLATSVRTTALWCR